MTGQNLQIAQPTTAERRSLWMIYFVLFATLGVYMLVLMHIRGTPGFTERTTGGDLRIVTISIGSVALVVFGLSLLVGRLIGRKLDPAEAWERYIICTIVRLAMAEGIATLGLVLGFWGANPPVFMPFFMLATVAFLIHSPTRSNFDDFCGHYNPAPTESDEGPLP